MERIDQKRIAIHEAGHLVMALMLGLDVLGCDVSRKRASSEGELGRCLVFDPDPVGIRKFLVAMAGIMAENHFYSDDRGGLKDRKDALAHLRRFLRHYNRMPAYDSLKPVLEEASALFHKPGILMIVEEAADMLVKRIRIESVEVDIFRKKIRGTGDFSILSDMVDELVEPEAPLNWKETGLILLKKIKELVLRLRKM